METPTEPRNGAQTAICDRCGHVVILRSLDITRWLSEWDGLCSECALEPEPERHEVQHLFAPAPNVIPGQLTL